MLRVQIPPLVDATREQRILNMTAAMRSTADDMMFAAAVMNEKSDAVEGGLSMIVKLVVLNVVITVVIVVLSLVVIFK